LAAWEPPPPWLFLGQSLARPAVNVLFGVRLGVGWLATARIVTVAQFRPGVAECLLVGMLSVLVGMFN